MMRKRSHCPCFVWTSPWLDKCAKSAGNRERLHHNSKLDARSAGGRPDIGLDQADRALGLFGVAGDFQLAVQEDVGDFDAVEQVFACRHWRRTAHRLWTATR